MSFEKPPNNKSVTYVSRIFCNPCLRKDSHFPAEYQEEYFKQLTCERIMTKFINGHPQRVWIKAKGKRNEALDCRVYALAALHILNPNIEILADELERDATKAVKKESTQAKPKTPYEYLKAHNERVIEAYKNDPYWCRISEDWLRSGF